MVKTVEGVIDSHTKSGKRIIVPQFALDAADGKIASWSAAIVEAADTIEHLISSESAPIPESVRELANSTAKKLRNLGTQSSEYNATEIVGGLQRSAAAHPAASIGVGAVIGATLAGLLVRFGAANGSGEKAPIAVSNSAKAQPEQSAEASVSDD